MKISSSQAHSYIVTSLGHAIENSLLLRKLRWNILFFFSIWVLRQVPPSFCFLCFSQILFLFSVLSIVHFFPWLFLSLFFHFFFHHPLLPSYSRSFLSFSSFVITFLFLHLFQISLIIFLCFHPLSPLTNFLFSLTLSSSFCSTLHIPLFFSRLYYSLFFIFHCPLIPVLSSLLFLSSSLSIPTHKSSFSLSLITFFSLHHFPLPSLSCSLLAFFLPLHNPPFPIPFRFLPSSSSSIFITFHFPCTLLLFFSLRLGYKWG